MDYLRTDEYDHCHKYGKLDDSHNDLVGKHIRKSVLKVFVDFDFGLVDHIVVGGHQIHIQHFEVVISPIDRKFAKRNDARNDD